MSDEAVQRLHTALEDLEHKRRNHNQRIWVYAPIGEHGIANVTCGSAMCLAGDVLYNDGRYQFVVPPWTYQTSRSADPLLLEYVIRNEDLNWWRDIFRRFRLQDRNEGEDEDGIHDRMRQIGDVAQELLDLSVDDADDLFNSDNPLELLWAYGWRVSEGRIPLPERITEQLPTYDGRSSMTWNAVYEAARTAHMVRVG